MALYYRAINLKKLSEIGDLGLTGNFMKLTINQAIVCPSYINP